MAFFESASSALRTDPPTWDTSEDEYWAERGDNDNAAEPAAETPEAPPEETPEEV